ncbi:MAG TPA: CocE/NonD family hydrolase [Thermoanaerobaculia bacterium]|nr:CocE/NonD family hydrolase [Thermoanaerobaculia bacterium]
MKRCILFAAALLLALPLLAATPSSGTVTATSSASWTGATFVGAANALATYDGCIGPDGRPLAAPVTAGPVACDVYTLSVAADEAFWAEQSGGLMVRIDGYNSVTDFDLYVHRRNPDGTLGALADDSAGTLGAPELAFVENATGDFYVIVVGFTAAASSYNGLAALSVNPEFTRRGKPFSSYLHDVSQPDPNYDFNTTVIEQHKIPTRDGLLLDSWVIRPQGPLTVPVVLMVTPYYGGGSPNDGGRNLLGRAATELVSRGYAYAVVSVRGTGASEGCFSIGGPEEAKDTAQAVEYYASRTWANGNVGIAGVSYDGTTPQDVWVEAPPSLKTIVPISGISDLYKYNFVNGVPVNLQGFAFNTYYWGLVGLSPTPAIGYGGGQHRDPVSIPGATIGEVCAEQIWVQEGGVSSTIDGNKDGYWQLRDFHAELLASPGKPRASVFYIHGLQDWNVQPHQMEDWLTSVQATGVPFKAWLGQWAHAYPDRADWWNVLAAWFDQFLKGRDTGVLDGPRVQVKTDMNVWRHESAFPPRHVKKTTLFPRANGTLSPTTGSGAASYFDYQGRLASAEDQLLNGGKADRVLFVSEPLTKDIVISGMPRFEAAVTASGNRASLMLTLAERTPLGDRSINYAAISLNHVQSLAAGQPSVAGQRQNVGVNFYPQDDVIRAGSRIVLIAAGNLVPNGQPGPPLQPVSDGSTITIDLAGAKLTLPIDTTVTYEKE